MPASYIPLGGRVRLAVIALSFTALLTAEAIGLGLAELRVIERIHAGDPPR